MNESWRKALLVCGILSSLLYGAMIGAIGSEGYSRISQTPSELTAIGAPTRSLWMQLGAVYTVLVTAFGLGVWTSAGRDRALRIVGGLLVAYGSLGLLWPFPRCTSARCWRTIARSTAALKLDRIACWYLVRTSITVSACPSGEELSLGSS